MAEIITNALANYNQMKSDSLTRVERLKNLDLFVLDNSLRETTVGALRGHTLENKFEIFDQVKKVGLEHMIVASFSHMTRVGDVFIEELKARGEDFTNKYAFSELYDSRDDEGMPITTIPVGMQKCKELGIKNVIIEADLCYSKENERFDHQKRCALFDHHFRWIRENIAEDARILINVRDLPPAIEKEPELALNTVRFLAEYRPQVFAILTEDLSGTGKYMPEVLGHQIKICVDIMRGSGFDGEFLVHIHNQWGMANAGQLACLANGATGIWAGIPEEGAALGHASSALTIMNLVRLGNKKVLKKFNCHEIRNAAMAITKTVTGKDPHPKQPIYGKRAVDLVFGFLEIDPNALDLPKFFGVEAVNRITTLATEKMIIERLQRLFGDDPQFTLEMGTKMKEQMLEDLRNDIKEEYHSPIGISMLFDRAGGHKTEAMVEVLANFEITSVHISQLIDELHDQWRSWDLRDGVEDDRLTFDNFYDGFMKGYFGCYRCDETQQALRAINTNDDNSIDWNEFVVFLKWAGHQYPQTETSEELLDIAFHEGIIPAMQDELIKKNQCAKRL